MNKQAKNNALWGVSVFSIIAVILVASFVFAAHVVWPGGETDIVFNDQPLEDITFSYNFSVNATATSTLDRGNISKVNITLPSGFTALVNSNFTDALGNFTIDAGGNLVWENDTVYLINGTDGKVDSIKYFSFNATATTPGTFNFSIYTTNTTDTVGNNVTVTINDTTAPSNLSFEPTGDGAWQNRSQSNITINFSTIDNGIVDSIWVFLWNKTGHLANQTNYTFVANGSTSQLVDFTGVQGGINGDGAYQINFTVNDTFGNEASSAIINITLDNTAPSVTLTAGAASENTKTKITMDYSAVDARGGIKSGSCSVDRANAVIDTTNKLVVETGLSCGTAYSYTLTCKDHSSNSGSSSALSVTTTKCSGGGSAPGGGGGSGSGSSGGSGDDDEGGSGGGDTGGAAESDTEEGPEAGASGSESGAGGLGGASGEGLLAGGSATVFIVVIIVIIIIIAYIVMRKR
jgi:hypothetical protein